MDHRVRSFSYLCQRPLNMKEDLEADGQTARLTDSGDDDDKAT